MLFREELQKSARNALIQERGFPLELVVEAVLEKAKQMCQTVSCAGEFSAFVLRFHGHALEQGRGLFFQEELRGYWEDVLDKIPPNTDQRIRIIRSNIEQTAKLIALELSKRTGLTARVIQTPFPLNPKAEAKRKIEPMSFDIELSWN
jgi:hypothetical protein